jgi:hypothetical protein
MKNVRTSLLAMLGLMSLCGCGDAPPAAERHAMQSASVVFLQSPANLVIFDEAVDVRHAADTMVFIGILPGAIWTLIQAAREKSREHAVEQRRIAMTPYADEIKAFDFNARTRAMFSSAVADSPWLHGKPIETVPWTDDQENYVRGRPGEVIVCIRPVYALDPYSNEFIVYVFVGIQQLDVDYAHGIRSYDQVEFTFQHLPTDVPPGMSYQQHWQAQQAAQALPHDRALQQWFADDGALLKADFAADMQQVEAGTRKLLRSRTAASR